MIYTPFERYFSDASIEHNPGCTRASAVMVFTFPPATGTPVIGGHLTTDHLDSGCTEIGVLL